MDDPVVVIDPCGRIVELNPAAERLVGQTSRAILGTEAARAFRGWPALADRLGHIGDHGDAVFELDSPDPVKAWAFDARLSRLGDGLRAAGWVLVLRDITAWKRTEAERARMLSAQAARAEAEAANRAK